MKKYIYFSLILFLISSFGHYSNGQNLNNYPNTQSSFPSKQCTQTDEETVESLANCLKKGTKSDLEKAKAIYVWLTENISYADDDFNSGKYGDMSAKGVLLSRKAVCGGFSNLFLALGRCMGLEIEKVVGYAKGYGYSIGTTFKKTDHAWNIIKIDGLWHIFDSTWGEGAGENINGKLVSEKKFDSYWFDINPYRAIFTHFPENEKFILVNPPLSLKTFEQLPYIEDAYFKMGFSGYETYEKVLADNQTTFPKAYMPDTYIKMRIAPKYETLFINDSYEFEFLMPKGVSMLLIDAQDNRTSFDKEKGLFKLNYSPNTEGSLEICIKYENGGDDYSTILTYNVKQKMGR